MVAWGAAFFACKMGNRILLVGFWWDGCILAEFLKTRDEVFAGRKDNWRYMISLAFNATEKEGRNTFPAFTELSFFMTNVDVFKNEHGED